jgi:hypothetical protein
VDLPERAKGAVKNNSGLRVYRELGQGLRGETGIYLCRSLFPQKTPIVWEFFATLREFGQLRHKGYKALASGQSFATVANMGQRGSINLMVY